jgi:hypothetical protein
VLLTGPAPVIFGSTSLTAQVHSFVIDAIANSVTITYVNPANPAQSKVASAVLTPGQVTAVRNLAASIVQANEGWASPPVVT